MSYFVSPRILFGKGALKQLEGELQGKGDRAILISGKTMGQNSGELSAFLEGCGFKVKVWTEADPEPSTQNALAAAEATRDFGADLIIGLGGGSSIDVAKAAWVIYAHPELTGEDFWKGVNPKSRLDLRKKACFLAVPTTSGSGSDVGWAAVLTDKTKNRKVAMANKEIVPDFTLLLPELTVSMPDHLTAGTGLDVLGHAFDGYTARQQTDFSDGLCLQAIRLCLEWLPKAYQDGNDVTAREKMQNAASIAGLGFGNSNTSLCHSLAHALGTVFGIPHGRAVGLSLIPSLQFIAAHPPLENAPDPAERLVDVARFVGIYKERADEAILELMKKIGELRKRINEPADLKAAGFSRNEFNDQLDSLVSQAGKDVNMFSCPCACDSAQLGEMFNNMFEGSAGPISAS